MPSVDPMDPNFRRLRYCRYADDFLIGIIGSKAEARQVMAAVQDFLSAHLNLTVSAEKSGITAASKGARFLGYHVCAFTLRSAGSMARRVRGGRSLRVRRRPTRGNIKLWVPRERRQRVLPAQRVRQSRHGEWPIAPAVPGLQRCRNRVGLQLGASRLRQLLRDCRWREEFARSPWNWSCSEVSWQPWHRGIANRPAGPRSICSLERTMASPAWSAASPTS